MTTVGKSPLDRLQIADSPISKQPVEPVAAYSGSLSARELDEFDRRYGPSDYVIIEHKGQDGMPVGRVYSWPDGTSIGPNPALQAVKPGTPATVVAPDGKVRFQGEIRAVHDFIKSEVLGEWVSPDKTRKAVLQKAGWSDANMLSVVNQATGEEKQLRALGFDGYRYQEVRWLSNQVLLESEGDGHEVGLYTIDLRLKVPTAVLLDGAAAARDLREAGVAIRPGDGAATLTGYKWQGDRLYYDLKVDMADGQTSKLQWQATLFTAPDGAVRLIDRGPRQLASTLK